MHEIANHYMVYYSDKYLALLVLHPGLDLLAETFALVQAGEQQ